MMRSILAALALSLSVPTLAAPSDSPEVATLKTQLKEQRARERAAKAAPRADLRARQKAERRALQEKQKAERAALK